MIMNENEFERWAMAEIFKRAGSNNNRTIRIESFGDKDKLS